MRARVRAVAISPSRSTRSMVPTGKKGRTILMLAEILNHCSILSLLRRVRRLVADVGENRAPVRGVLGKGAEHAHLLEYGGRHIEAGQKDDLASLQKLTNEFRDRRSKSC